MPLRLVLTCGACPEQYDVYDGDRQVGYIRLRHGALRVDCPDTGGETVYEATPEGDGSFEPHERDYYLRFCVAAIERWMRGKNVGRPPAPDVEYTIEGEPGF